MTIPQRLRLHTEVAGWINKPPPQERRQLQLFPALLVRFIRKIIASNYTLSIKYGVFRQSYCVCAHPAPQCAPTHASTCPILLREAHLSTPRNNFAESHGVINIREFDWLGRNTSRFLESPMMGHGPITVGDEREEGWISVMRRSVAQNDWDI